MADSLETLQVRLQQAQAEYMRALQDNWEAWLKQFEELSQEQLRAYQDIVAQLENASRGCCAIPDLAKK
jgi:hypothetical protein